VRWRYQIGLYVAIAEIGPGYLKSSTSFSALTISEMHRNKINILVTFEPVLASGHTYFVTVTCDLLVRD
jgi:hypothetical protein